MGQITSGTRVEIQQTYQKISNWAILAMNYSLMVPNPFGRWTKISSLQEPNIQPPPNFEFENQFYAEARGSIAEVMRKAMLAMQVLAHVSQKH